MDLYFQGLAWINKGLTLDHVARARSFYDRALTADPDNVDGLIASAAADVADGANSYVTDAMAALAAAEGKLTKALSSGRGEISIQRQRMFTSGDTLRGAPSHND